MRIQWQLIKEATGEILVRDLEIANTWWKRLCGLQFRKSFPSGKAILLVPCSSIHTHWVNFPIDVVMVDKHGVVLDKKENVKPWRMLSAPKNTYGVLEWIPETVRISVGERLRVVAHPKGALLQKPKNLDYLLFE